MNKPKPLMALINIVALIAKMNITNETLKFRDNQSVDSTTVYLYTGNKPIEVVF